MTHTFTSLIRAALQSLNPYATSNAYVYESSVPMQLVPQERLTCVVGGEGADQSPKGSW